MKVSVSLPDRDVDFLDEYAEKEGMRSRSAVLLRAVRLLRAGQLDNDYAAAWAEWEAGGDSALWDSTVGDGL